MADIAQLDLKPRGEEAKVRGLLEDLLDYYKEALGRGMALGVWFAKTPQSQEHKLLLLYTGPRLNLPNNFLRRQSLLWKTRGNEPPFANIYAASVDDFSDLLASSSQDVAQYRDGAEVLYFDKNELTPEILQEFNVIVEPSGLIKGWYFTLAQYDEALSGGRSLASWQQTKPQLGLVKTREAESFEYCRGLIHVEVGQKWLPLSQAGVVPHVFYSDVQDHRPGYFLFQGGSIYRLLKIEIKTNPEYSARVREETRDNAFATRDDTYVEVYLRAVPASEQPAA